MNEADGSTVSPSSKRMTLCVNLTLINLFEAILFAGQSVRAKKTTQLFAKNWCKNSKEEKGKGSFVTFLVYYNKI